MKVKLVETSAHIYLFRINVGIVLNHVPKVHEFLMHLDGIQALENEKKLNERMNYILWNSPQ